MAIEIKNKPAPAVNAMKEILDTAAVAAKADAESGNNTSVSAKQLQDMAQNNNNSGVTIPVAGSAGVSPYGGVAVLSENQVAKNIDEAEQHIALKQQAALDSLTVADLRAGALSHPELSSLLATLGIATQAPSRQSELMSAKAVYQFPSAPTTYQFPWARTKITIPDGIYGTNDEREIADLEEAVEAGNIWRYDAKENYASLAPTTQVTLPVRMNAVN